MTLAYHRPASIQPNDLRTVQEVAAARKAARRPSRNDSTSLRRYNNDGICCYHRTEHRSYHGHGYIIEINYHGSYLTTTIVYDNGMTVTYRTKDVERWRISQRRQLVESSGLLMCVLECLTSLCTT